MAGPLIPTDNGANLSSGNGALTPQQVRGLAYQAGFRGSGLNTIVQITTPESGRVPTARYAPGPQEDSRGLAQINIAPTANPEYGHLNLYNPLVNLQVAYKLSKGGTDFSPWTTYTSGKYASAPAGNGAGQSAGLSLGPSAPATSGPSKDALIAGNFLANEPKINPYQTPGEGKNPLLSLGILPSGTQTTPLHVAVAQGKLQALAGGTALNDHPALTASGYTNPIPGATLGRTDMGVDANLPVGHPIVALGDSKVVGIAPNWYKGQPYVLMQLTSGPDAGKYWYVAEQIAPTVRPGQTVKAGEQIGTYAPSGTGIEIGFGSPTPGRTQAQATTGYSEGQVTPAGQSFRNLLGQL